MTVSCALLFFVAIVACRRTVTPPTPPAPPTLQSKIVGKWTMVAAIANSTNYGVNYTDTTAYTSADYFEFKADSTLSIMAKGVAYNGNWRIDSSKLFITGTNYIDYVRGFQLPILDQHNLQLYYTETQPDTYLEEKLNLLK
ncbi:MAG TPA: hypothetical protein VGM89_16200 [Puia sp.]